MLTGVHGSPGFAPRPGRCAANAANLLYRYLVHRRMKWGFGIEFNGKAMTRIVLDTIMWDKLLGLNSPLELCDDKGNVVAHVMPVRAQPQYLPSEPQVSREELRRRAASNERRYSTDEVLKYLESLDA